MSHNGQANEDLRPAKRMRSSDTELGTFAGACIRCREKKIKCDTNTPRCGACVKAKSECVLSSLLNDRVYDRKYVTDLQQSVQDLQNELDELNQALRDLNAPSDPARPTTQPMNETPSFTGSNAQTTSHRTSDLIPEETAIPRWSRNASPTNSDRAENDLTTTAESLVSLSKMNGRGEGDHFNSKLILSQILGTNGSNPYETSSTRAGAGDVFLRPSQTDVPDTLSSFLSEHADTLVQRYENQIHTKYPFLDMKDIKTTMVAFEQPASASDTLRPRPCAKFSLLMASVIAMVSDGHDIPFAEHFESLLVISALGEVPRILEASKPLEEIHVSLLLAIYSLYKPSLGSTWHYVGLALRTCIAQGYHSKHVVRDNAKVAIRLAFWSCFALTQECSQVLDRPDLLTVADISMPLHDSREDTLISWIPFQWFLSSLRSREMSHLHCIRALYNWYMRYCKTQALAQTVRGLEESYLMAVLDFSNQDLAPWSISQAQLVFLASVCLINRINASRAPTWISGLRAFRAGLFCISSGIVLQDLYAQGTIIQQLNQSISTCTQTLARIATSFASLSTHGSNLLQLMTAAMCRNTVSEDLVQALRTSHERRAARRIIQSLQCSPTAGSTYTTMSRHMAKFLNALDCMSDDEKLLTDSIFNNS